MKHKKLQKILDEVEEFIADHDMKNRHYLRDHEVVKYFGSVYKKKHVKQALEQLR